MKTLIAIFIFLFTCPGIKSNPSFFNSVKQPGTVELKELFVDSLNIGRKKYNKVELALYNILDSNYVVIKFYSRINNTTWKLIQTFSFEKDEVTSLDTELSDLNNDGFKDMTYRSNIAARGANEVRRLFIYDKNMDKFVYMKNSEDYPNMQYNKELNCIDAFLVYGGCSTVFLRISGDSLKAFASVELFDGLTVSTYDKNGKEKVILRDKKNKDQYIRYKNFRPLKAYNE